MKPSSALEPLTARLRRVQFLIGLGFSAAVVGALLAAPLQQRLLSLSEVLPRLVVALASYGVVRLWVLAVLPAFCYGAARVLDLKPWSSALGAAAVGEGFYLALDLVSSGWEGLIRQWVWLLLRAATLAVGVFLSRQAILRGRAGAARAQARARQVAEANRSQYLEFAREAERLASRHDASPPAAEGPVPPPASAPEPAAAEPAAEPPSDTAGASRSS